MLGESAHCKLSSKIKIWFTFLFFILQESYPYVLVVCTSLPTWSWINWMSTTQINCKCWPKFSMSLTFWRWTLLSKMMTNFFCQLNVWLWLCEGGSIYCKALCSEHVKKHSHAHDNESQWLLTIVAATCMHASSENILTSVNPDAIPANTKTITLYISHAHFTM